MRVDKLYEGQIFKNYGHLCETLEIEKKNGNAKTARMKKVECYCLIRKEGHKIIVESVYDTPLPLPKGRGGVSIDIPLVISNPLLTSEWHSYLNGCEIDENMTRTEKDSFWWRCRECENAIYSSPHKRIRVTNGDGSDMYVNCMYCVLSSGARKVADFLMNYGLKYTTEVTFDGLVGQGGNNLRYDFAILSDKDEILALIEYDGEFHYYAIGDKDIDKSTETLKRVQFHDRLKNKYCEDNNIPLVRVPFFKEDNLEELVYELIDSISKGENHVSHTASSTDPVELIINNRIVEIDRHLDKYEVKIERLKQEKDELIYELRMSKTIERK